MSSANASARFAAGTISLVISLVVGLLSHPAPTLRITPPGSIPSVSVDLTDVRCEAITHERCDS